MICKVCGKESQDGLKFCGHCGSNLEGKVKCLGCNQWVNEDFTFCPHCSTKLNHKQDPAVIKIESEIKQEKNKNILFSSITNSIVIILCLGMALLLFGKIANYKFDTLDEKISVPANIVNFYESGIKGISDYSITDFTNQYKNINLNDIESYQKINFLNVHMIDEYHDQYMVEKILIYVDIVLITAMLAIPLILFGMSIYNLIKFNNKPRYKKFFLFTLITGFILALTLPMIGYAIGSASVFYILFSCIGLIYSYIIEIVSKEKSFNRTTFTINSITSILIFGLIFIATSSIVKLTYTPQVGSKQTENINFGGFISLINHINIDKTDISLFTSNFIKFLVDITKTNGWITYSVLLIPILMIFVLGFLISSLISETLQNTNLTKGKSYSTFYIWTAFVFEILIIIDTVILVTGFNRYLMITNDTNYHLQLSMGIIFLTFITLALSLYKSVVSNLSK